MMSNEVKSYHVTAFWSRHLGAILEVPRKVGPGFGEIQKSHSVVRVN